jgi:S-adenosylmethionine:tRNA ribosyltransferase-isomerase
MNELDAYDYDLPPEQIAQFPLPDRESAKLLVVRRDRQTIEHAQVRDLPEFLTAADCLALNNTKVVPARLVGLRTTTGGRWQGLFLAYRKSGDWEVLGRTRGKLQANESITLLDPNQQPAAELIVVEKLSGGRWLMRPKSREVVWDLLARVGRVPLPPYIRGGEMEASDTTTYQTVYAREPGAVAAPTAGLHFTDQLLERIRSRGVVTTSVTLHVGLGTFRPMVAERLADHEMHHEWGRLTDESARCINERRAAGGRLLAVGTTVVRVLETVAQQPSPNDAALRSWSGETNLFIRPPFQFRAVDALLTNFHLPKSTLLVLVRTFGGDDLLRRAYDEAVRSGYRFFSYGDAMLIL